MRNIYIAIDFDGTIAEHEFPDIGPEVPGAFEWMKRFQELGAKLFLWTMRSDNQRRHPNVLSDAVAFCKERGIEFIGINENPEEDWSGSNKQYAHIYIDDAAWGTPLVARGGSKPYVDWKAIGPEIEAFLMERGVRNYK